jgi:antitoxin (DNA-binding transcriptional repressor) of toxin-antitoxin stability system
MKVSAQYAEDHFADLLNLASSGEEVEIALPGKPNIKLVPSSPTPFQPKSGRRILGAGRGEMVVPSEAEWQKMDQELLGLINDSPLFPVDDK